MVNIIKVLSLIGLVILFLLLALLIMMTVFQYNPDDIEKINLMGNFNKKMDRNKVYSALSWNIGYGGLDKDTDFFMDGGQMVLPISKNKVKLALENILLEIKTIDADLNFLQEVDEDSKRTYGINQVAYFHNKLGYVSSFAYNYKAFYIPYPLPKTLGRMASGILLNSKFHIKESFRYQQPIPFKWPVSTANLKRAFTASYTPIDNSEKFLVAINIHLDAYDKGHEGKIAQTRQVMEFMEKEFLKRNYVLAGGEWNQDLSPSGPMEAPQEIWRPQTFPKDFLPQGFNIYSDPSVYTTRTNHKPYDPNDSYEYVIDGYIISDNIEVLEVMGLDKGYEYADHNPVYLKFSLK